MVLPDLESLRCFVEGARLLNFRAAARAVALTPAAFGVRIRQLEEQVGTALFHRTTRKVVLTPAGLAMLPRARRTLDEARTCLVADENNTVSMQFTLGTRHELGMSWVLPALPVLERAHPGVTFHLYFGSGADLLIRVRTLEVDAAIGSMASQDAALDSAPLHPEAYAWVGARRLLERVPLRRAEDAAAHVLVDVAPSLPLFRYLRDAPGCPAPMRFQATRFLGTIAAIHQHVLDGHGVAVLPRYLVEEDVARGRLQVLFPRVKPLSDAFRLFFRADDPRRSVMEAVAGTLRTLPLR